MCPAGSEPAPFIFSRLEPSPVVVSFLTEGAGEQRPWHG